MVVSHNLLAMNANRRLGITNKSKSKSTEKLASGYRINRAADDAAGLAISEKTRHQIRGMSQGVENTQDGVSLCQVADGALAEVNEMLNRMTKLSIQAANGTNSESDRAAIQREINELKVEITRIGKNTKFNDKLVFDSGKEIPPTSTPTYSMTSLIKSPAADTGYFTEAFLYNGKYYPAASLDFRGINEDNVKYLYDKSFSFTCGLGCTEDFTFTLVNGDGHQSRHEGIPNVTIYDRNPHHYYVDIHGMEEGKQIVSALYQCIKDYPPGPFGTAGTNELNVSHSNAMRKISDDVLLIRTINDGQTTEEAAKKVFPKSSGSTKGMIDCSEFTMEVEELEENIEFGHNTTPIQTSGEQNDRVDIVIDYMNSGTLGINKLDVTTEKNATKAIEIIKDASAIISKQRSRIGAYQNRLEHTIANEKNIIENTTAAESQIRDTDMATEMVKYSNENILAQAGQSMLVQANQSKDGVLALLGNTEK